MDSVAGGRELKALEADSVCVFSVVVFAPQEVSHARKIFEDLQAQTLSDFECVVVCTELNDGVQASCAAVAGGDSRFRLFSADAKTPGGRLLQALRQCRGKYIAIHPQTGHFLPETLEIVSREFGSNTDVAGLCGEEFLVDGAGRSLADVDIVTLLLTSYYPYVSAGFLDRAALIECGLNDGVWESESVELDIWCRIAADFGVASLRRKVVSHAHPRVDVIAPPQDANSGIAARLRLIDQCFGPQGFFDGARPALALESRINQLSILRSQMKSLPIGGATAEASIVGSLERAVAELRALLMRDHRVLRTLDRLARDRAHALGSLERPVRAFLAMLSRMPGRPPIHAGYSMWNFPVFGPWLSRTMFVEALPAPDMDVAPLRSALLADVYRLMGSLYDLRGQISQALIMWERARQPGDMAVDSLACQALLKIPGISNAEVADAHRRWIAPHVVGLRPVAPDRVNVSGRKIRIGYHCVFMNSDTIRAIMSSVIASHDRADFEVYGYSPERFIEGVTPSFDVFRHTPSLEEFTGDPPVNGRRLSDEAFVELIRRDRLDVFIELSGFTPGHRNVAMGHRIASVQISYLNHLGTSLMPNVDYILTDEISVPLASDVSRHYSEKLYRVPGCFLSYDYTKADLPAVAAPPATQQPFVTFGYYGGGSKLNSWNVALWARLLHRVPTAKLRLQNPTLSQSTFRRMLVDRFVRHGISADRLILVGGVERLALLEEYSQIDISLDTWPYCGGNTIAESLWQGVPVVTYRGDRFTSAYGASLVTAAGCGSLVADSPDQFIEIAAALAEDPARLLFLRHNLRRLSVEHGLADSTGMARRLEEAYRDMLGQLADVDGRRAG